MKRRVDMMKDVVFNSQSEELAQRSMFEEMYRFNDSQIP
jgi:hypothetical protein